MPRILLTLIILLQALSIRALADCVNDDISPKIACAKEGDLSAEAGDLEGAVLFWKKSCQLGLNSSCSLVKKYESDSSRYYRDYKTSPQISGCLGESLADKECLNLAIISQGHNPSASARILASLCKRGVKKACTGLGEIYLNGSGLAAAKTLFEKGCRMGEAKACGRLDQVNSEMTQKQNRLIAQKLSEIERRQKLKNRADFYYRLNKSEDLSELLYNSAIHSQLD